MREQEERSGGDLRNRHEILDHVERHALVQPLVEHGGNIEEKERAAVRRGLGDVIDTSYAARADSILDHHRLLEPLLQTLGKHPADGVHAAAGRDRHDQRDRARGFARRRLRVQGSNGTDRDRENSGRQRSSRAHACPFPVLRPCYRGLWVPRRMWVTVTRRRCRGKRPARQDTRC